MVKYDPHTKTTSLDTQLDPMLVKMFLNSIIPRLKEEESKKVVKDIVQAIEANFKYPVT
jgi:hypothetical protein